mgnify:CR=1 FL=1
MGLGGAQVGEPRGKFTPPYWVGIRGMRRGTGTGKPPGGVRNGRLFVFSLGETVPAAACECGTVFVIVIGNLFVRAFEVIIAGIRVLRREFYELFSRFYGGNGVSYSPLKLRSNLNR